MQSRPNTIASLASLLCSPLLCSPMIAMAQSQEEEKNSSAFEWSFTQKNDVISNLKGGAKKGTRGLNYTELKAQWDLEKLGAWSVFNNTQFVVLYHSELGGKPNGELVQSFMGVNNIEVTTNTGQFSSFYLEKTNQDQSLSLLAGLYSIDSEFFATESSSIFLHPSMGMGTSLGQTGKNGPPIFPHGALSLRFKWNKENWYSMAALSDGIPGDPHNSHGTHIKLERGDGSLLVWETGYQAKEEDEESSTDKSSNKEWSLKKSAFGFWRYSGQFPTAFSDLEQSHHNYGWYWLSEVKLPQFSPTQSTLFFRIGNANANLNQISWSINTGLHMKAPFASRPEDQAGIAFTYAHISPGFRELNQTRTHESMVEANYQFRVTPWLKIQPNLQYIIHPSLNNTQPNAWLIGTRFEINF
jgi:porin